MIPSESTLRAILELPGVAGSTRHTIESYLDDPDRHEEDEGSYDDLLEVVQIHWSQLAALKKV